MTLRVCTCGKHFDADVGQFYCRAACRTADHQRMLGRPQRAPFSTSPTLAPTRRSATTTTVAAGFQVLADLVGEQSAPERRRARQGRDRAITALEKRKDLTSPREYR